MSSSPETVPSAEPAAALSRKGPLAGLRVIDAGNMIAGPLAATQMADFGADVIKLELPGSGDSMRHWTPMKEGLSLWWKVIARNKRLITLTLSNPRGQELFRELIREADVLIENYRPGTFERWGLGYDELARINPRLVMVRVSGFGQTGPYARRGGYGTIAEAFSGIPSFTGAPDRPPTLPGFPMADSVASTFAAMAAMFAVYNRDHGNGQGQEIDVSLYEPLFRLVESQVIGFDQLGIVKQRLGNRLAEDSPRNTYQTLDGRWVGISASSQRTFERLAQALGMPELITDPRFVDNASRCEHDTALDEIIAGWFRERDCAAVMALFEEAEVVAGPVLDISDIVRDPHYQARENIVSVPDDDFGQVRMQGVVPRFLDTPGEVRHAGRALGADNREIYQGLLGVSPQEFDALTAQGVI
ncbi:CoA transferase [Achromobacter veterisilvae]|jgi:crotonobetainyl-CoA:carnitine CoA-transferase CaiB-like acyl-CoA transferase|uniref:CoA transferase n=1 Tax=Achromobacter veterisilvae TaxID=2069367 RepID=A0A446CWG8_9BURK|nr:MULTISPECIES: CoA transferase [Achromobacter]MCW0206029.1 CoA transferase [Achromobacter sp.]SSW72177.1 Succinyl-CoA--L-malate CoA-transferase beta subunit [Achromobacter veterisilvae]